MEERLYLVFVWVYLCVVGGRGLRENMGNWEMFLFVTRRKVSWLASCLQLYKVDVGTARVLGFPVPCRL